MMVLFRLLISGAALGCMLALGGCASNSTTSSESNVRPVFFDVGGSLAVGDDAGVMMAATRKQTAAAPEMNPAKALGMAPAGAGSGGR